MAKVKVKIAIAGRQYPLSVQPEEEETLRLAGKELNQAIKNMESQYAVGDKQDVLAMCALQFAAKYFAAEKQGSSHDAHTAEQLQQMILQIKEVLK